MHNNLGSYSIIPKNPVGRSLANQKESLTMGIYLNQLGEVAFRPMFVSKSFPRSKNKAKSSVREYWHETPKNGKMKVLVHSEIHKTFDIYRQPNSWNCRAIMETELDILNRKMAKENRKVALCLDNASCHKKARNPFKTVRMLS